LDGTQSRMRIGNYLSASVPIENSLNPEYALSPLPLNMSLELAIRKVQETNFGVYVKAPIRYWNTGWCQFNQR
jgi:hypothetical protein